MSIPLPPPPPDHIGWPWTAEPPPLTPLPHYPKITIITPSFNQGEYLEALIRSVLLQNYPNCELLVFDGGSGDRTLEILHKYEGLIQWVSQRDRGQSDAVNQGLDQASGELVGWQNSDDLYGPHAFYFAAQAWLNHPESDVIYGKIDHLSEAGDYLFPYPVKTATVANMIPYSAVTNHSVFLTQNVIQAGERLDLDYHHCMDQEFILRLLLKGYKFTFEPNILAYWRLHDQSKSSQQMQIWAREAFRLCERVYRDAEIGADIREQAKDCLYSLCRDSFAKGRMAVFREQVGALRSHFGPLPLELRCKAAFGQLPGAKMLIDAKAKWR
ncbi:MAG: glycosyltransferase [Spirulina sp. DLM2.Bin59]|nr:MAG: glycosyltransferase [Spirulina sp. DLM2.Bin59]